MGDFRTYTTAEVAEMLGVKGSYLRKLRQLNKGPKYFRLGRMVRYRKEDVEIWLKKAMIEVIPRGVV